MSSAAQVSGSSPSPDPSGVDQQPDINNDLAAMPDDDTDDDPDDGGGGDLPMSMTTSVILANLPKDSNQALKEIEEIDNRKVSVRFQAIGSAPVLKQRVFKISASSRFSVVMNFLRKKIGIREGDGLFLYVNSVFAPGLDEGVGNLFRARVGRVLTRYIIGIVLQD